MVSGSYTRNINANKTNWCSFQAFNADYEAADVIILKMGIHKSLTAEYAGTDRCGALEVLLSVIALASAGSFTNIRSFSLYFRAVDPQLRVRNQACMPVCAARRQNP
jgi:hypothetical protein